MDFLSELMNRKTKKENKPKPKKKSPFEYHNKLFKGNLEKKDYKEINEYLLMNHLSNDKRFIDILNTLNMINIPKDKIIYLLTLIVNQARINYIKYPSKPKIKNDKYIDSIKWYFNVNELTARRYLQHLDEKYLKQLLEDYKNSK